MPGHVARREYQIDREVRRNAKFSSFFSSCIQFGDSNYIAPGLLIAYFVDTVERVHAIKIRSNLSSLPRLDTHTFSSRTLRIKSTRTKLRRLSLLCSDWTKNPVESMQYMEHHLFLLMPRLWYIWTNLCWTRYLIPIELRANISCVSHINNKIGVDFSVIAILMQTS